MAFGSAVFLKFCVYVRDGFLPILSPRETVSKLGVGELMQPSSRCHTEVAPHVLVAAEIQLLHCSRAWLETLRSYHTHTHKFHLFINQNQKISDF